MAMSSDNALYCSDFIPLERGKKYALAASFIGHGVSGSAGKDLVAVFELLGTDKSRLDIPVPELSFSQKYGGHFVYLPIVATDDKDFIHQGLVFPEQAKYVKMYLYKWNFVGEITFVNPPTLVFKQDDTPAANAGKGTETSGGEFASEALYSSDFIAVEKNAYYELIAAFTGDGSPAPDGKDVIVAFDLFDDDRSALDEPVAGLNFSGQYGRFIYRSVEKALFDVFLTCQAIEFSSAKHMKNQTAGRHLALPEQTAYIKVRIYKWHFDGQLACARPPIHISRHDEAPVRNYQDSGLYYSDFIALEPNKTYELVTALTGEGAPSPDGKDAVVAFELFDADKALIDEPALGLHPSQKYGQYLYASVNGPDAGGVRDRFIAFPEQAAYVRMRVYSWHYGGLLSCAQPPALVVKKRNAIVFICDDAYAGLTSVAITSLLYNKKTDSAYDIYIIYTGSNEDNISRLLKLRRSTANISILRQEPISNDLFVHYRVSQAALCKFQIHDKIAEYDTVLYCDSDVIFTSDISELFETELDGAYAAVVKDAMGMLRYFDHARLNKKLYFNSGIMLLNLKMLRAEDAAQKLIYIKENICEKRYMDQDVFNIYFEYKLVFLDCTYNYMISNTLLDEKEVFYIYEKMHSGHKIIHYTGIRVKDIKELPLHGIWVQYHKRSPFSDLPISPLKALPPDKNAPASPAAKPSDLLAKEILNLLNSPARIAKQLENLDKEIVEVKKQVNKNFDTLRHDLLQYMEFLSWPVSEKSVLLVEGATCHAETLPGLAFYFQKLGFAVDILLTKEIFESFPFSRLDTSGMHIHYADRYSLREMLRIKKIGQYEYIVFNTRSLYYEMKYTCHPLYDEFYTGITPPKKKILAIEHHFEFLPPDKSNILALESIPHDRSFDRHVVYPYHFGKIDITAKNTDHVTFIAVGNFEKSRRDHDLLFRAAIDLRNKTSHKIKIILIGRGREKLSIPAELSDVIELHQWATYEKIYQCMEEADYFLPLMNPEIPQHFRYIEYGTSGSIQLIYAFLKPCVIHDKFAPRFGFNDKNSILYADNDDFASTLDAACALHGDSYKQLQSELSIVADEKQKRSLENLKYMLFE